MAQPAPTVADAMVTDVKLSGAATTVREVRSLFADDHIHSAVFVERGVLLGVVDRADLPGDAPEDAPALRFAVTRERVVSADADLGRAQRRLIASGRRRLAVVDADGRFAGLLCLKRSLAGFCSDQDVGARRENPW